MLVRVRCSNPECGERYKLDDALVGRSTVCRHCGREFTVIAPARETLLPAAGLETNTAVPSEPLGDMPKQLGRFEIRSGLGHGAFGAVYRAYDPVLDREVALKVPRAAVLAKPEARARFLREPKAAAQLRHPHIVPVFDAGSDGQHYYIASAYIEGRTLEDVIAEDRLDFRRAAEIVRNLAGALDYAHQVGVVHRDVKPANVMIDVRGQALLMDFGLARLESEEEKLTQDGSVMGTPAYMAPEQADSSVAEVGPAADQYSLGAVMYELLCGQTPFSGPPTVLIYNALHEEPPSPRSVNSRVPRDLETICVKTMAKEPKQRYSNCSELAEDLRRYVAGEPIRARRMGLWERGWRWGRQNPILAGLISAVGGLALLSTFTAIGLFSSRQELGRALLSEKAETERAERQTELAERQTALAGARAASAQQWARHAQEQERIAREAFVKLQDEVDARKSAESEKAAALEREQRLAGNLQQRESDLEKSAEALEQAKSETESEVKARQEILAFNTWLAYTENLKAADLAYQGNDKKGMVAFLNACPKEHRAWEWHYLKKLSEGLRPTECRVNMDLSDSLLVSSNAAWIGILKEPGTVRDQDSPKVAIYRVAEDTPFYTLSTYVDDAVLNPNGRTLLYKLRGRADSWRGSELHNNSKLQALTTKRFGKFDRRTGLEFSPDGKLVVGISLGKRVLASAAKGETLHEFTYPTANGPFFCGPMTFVPNGTWAVLVMPQNTARAERLACLLLWTFGVNGFQAAPPVSIDLPYPVKLRSDDRLRFSQDGQLMIHSMYEETIVFDVTKKKVLWKTGKEKIAVALSPDARRLAFVGGAGIRLWDISLQRELPVLQSLSWQSTHGVSGPIFSPDWTRVVARVPQIAPNGPQADPVLLWSTVPPAKVDAAD